VKRTKPTIVSELGKFGEGSISLFHNQKIQNMDVSHIGQMQNLANIKNNWIRTFHKHMVHKLFTDMQM
jgi:hypothetical protein